MTTPTGSELLSATFEKVLPTIADAATNHIPLYKWLTEKGQVQPQDGGTSIRHFLQYQTNGTYTRFQGYEELNIAALETITHANYDPKYVAVSTSISGQEELENSGEAQLIDLVASKIEGMKAEFYNNMDIDLWSDGTGYGGRQIGGLQSIVADSPSAGIVGGLNAATLPFWRNFAYDATTDFGAAASSANIKTLMTNTATERIRGADIFDVILADANYWRFLHDAELPIQRHSSTKYHSGSLDLNFMGRPVKYCGGVGAACPANHMYFLVSSTIKLRPHSRRNFTAIGGDRVSINQDGTVKITGWQGNLTCGNRLFNAVLKD